MGKYLFYIQLTLIMSLFYFGDLDNLLSNTLATFLFTLGTLLALWAFYNMGSKNYSPFPEPRPTGKFTQSGVYKYIRHPMYAGLMLITSSLFLSNLNFTSFVLYAALLYVLDEKATLEETLLAKLHPAYPKYMEKTKKFIPFIY